MSLATVRAAKVFHLPYVDGPCEMRRPSKTSDSFLIRQPDGTIYLYDADKDELTQVDTQAWDTAEGKIWRVQPAEELPVAIGAMDPRESHGYHGDRVAGSLFFKGERLTLGGRYLANAYLSPDQQYLAVLSSANYHSGFPGLGLGEHEPPFFHDLLRTRDAARVGPALRLPFQQWPFVFWSPNNAFVIYRYRDQVCILRGRSAPAEKEK